MRMTSIWTALSLTLFALPSVTQAQEIKVLATGVFKSSMPALIEGFKAQGGANVTYSLGNAGVVDGKVKAGEAADVVMSSSVGIDKLIEAGKLARDSKVTVGRMLLGLGVRADAPKPNIGSAQELRALLLAAQKVALVDPKGGATAGVFVEKALVTLGIADAVHAKAVLCLDGAEVVKALAERKATVGMTQASEIAGAPDVAFIDVLPKDLNTPSIYSAALTAKPQAADAARAFMRYVTSPAGMAEFKKHGWDLSDLPKE